MIIVLFVITILIFVFVYACGKENEAKKDVMDFILSFIPVDDRNKVKEEIEDVIFSAEVSPKVTILEKYKAIEMKKIKKMIKHW